MSDLSGQAGDYLRLRRALGHKLDDAHRLLPRFVAYLDAIGAETVTVEAALGVGSPPRRGSGELGVDAPDERGPRLRPPHGRRRSGH